MSARRPSVLAAVIVLAVIVVAWAARVADGRRSIEASDSAWKRGDRVEAVVFARAAAEARCPFCSAPDLGYARLSTIAKDAEARGDDATAVAAWRAVRAASLATAQIDAAPARRTQADAEIARLEHRIDAAAAATSGSAPSPAASEERLRRALAGPAVPSGTVFVFLALGGALFLLGAVRLVRASSFRAQELVLALAGGAVAAIGILLF